MKYLFFLLMATFLATPIAAQAGKIRMMDVEVKGIDMGEEMPSSYAYCEAGKKGGHEDGENVRPKISWAKGPKETQSYAIIVIDPDVPANLDDINKEDVTIEADAPRQPFYHWAQVDIPADITELPKGKGRGLDKGQASHGIPGINDYATFLDPTRALEFKGWDGPCPPWNDMKVHHYHFIVAALDVRSLDLPQGFTARDAFEAIKAHTIAKGKVIGTYTTNPEAE